MSRTLPVLAASASVAVLLTCCAYSVTPHSTPEHEGISGILRAVVVTEADDRTCAGFIADEQRVVTAAHCVYEDRTVSVHFYGGASVPRFYRVIYRNVEQDIAILATYASIPNSARTLPVATRVQTGDRLIHVGHPSGLAYSVVSGEVSHHRRRFAFRRGVFVQASTPVWRGSSGGPAINMRGEVVGVAAFFIDRPTHAFFVHADAIRFALGATETCQ